MYSLLHILYFFNLQHITCSRRRTLVMITFYSMRSATLNVYKRNSFNSFKVVETFVTTKYLLLIIYKTFLLHSYLIVAPLNSIIHLL